MKCGNLDSRNNSEVNLVFIRYFWFSVILMFQIQDMFENGEPDIVLNTDNRFNIKKFKIGNCCPLHV